MKNKIFIFIYFYSGFSFSGMPVTDPTSYTYYIDQINKTTEIINNTTEQIETLGGIRTTVDQVKLSMHGAYNKTIRAISGAENAAERLANTDAPIRETLDINDTSGAYGSDDDVFEYSEGVKNYLDSFFADPRTIEEDIERPTPAQLNALKKAERQAAIRATIVNAEQVMSANDARLENLVELATEIDSSENIKEAQDLTNRFLYEILQLMNEFLSVYLMATEAAALADYDGLDKEKTDERRKEFVRTGSIEQTENESYEDFVKSASKKGWYQ